MRRVASGDVKVSFRLKGCLNLFAFVRLYKPRLWGRKGLLLPALPLPFFRFRAHLRLPPLVIFGSLAVESLHPLFCLLLCLSVFLRPCLPRHRVVRGIWGVIPHMVSSSSMDEKTSKALEAMLWQHDKDSIISNLSYPTLGLVPVAPMKATLLEVPRKEGNNRWRDKVVFQEGLLEDRWATLTPRSKVWFRVRYPQLEIKEDPYTTLREDDNVPMEAKVPFDDSDPPAI
ncbi:hypothetical protein GW17_00062068 [Ensete ventricosum]|nr:hypothetical protein GW17_00062068 [Ensete ventricosum]RZR90676.1 hypothetical protein BHM03_00018599 [Ensete ventricosum]